MARKTVNVRAMVDKVNLILASSVVSADYRKGMMALAEHMLHDSGNYRGFRYLTAREIPDNQLPGVHVDASGEMLPYPARFEGTDGTRIQFKFPQE